MNAQTAAPRTEDYAFVVFADDWGRHPSSCQHIFRRILPRADVLWVNTVGLRTPRLSVYDIKRSAEVISHWFLPGRRGPSGADAPAVHSAATTVRDSAPGTAPEDPGRDSEAPQSAVAANGASPVASPADLSSEAPRHGSNGRAPKVARPVMLPFFHWAWADALNQVLIRRGVDAALGGFAPGKPRILVSTLPIIPGLFRKGPWARKVYYCVDDFTTWPGVSGDTMRRLEQRLLPHADVIIATSTGLLETRGPAVKRAHLLTHGVDGAHFRQALSAPPHPALAGLPKPILGMFGSFDARVDGGILRDLATRFSGGSLVVLGPVDRDLSEFYPHKNIRFFGAVPYADLPAHISALDVLVLPYVVDASTDKINPLKLKEYLATGKPVVTTPLPEARRLSAFLNVADRGAFADAAEMALRQAAHRRAIPPDLEAFLQLESWEGKAEQFCRWSLEGLGRG